MKVKNRENKASLISFSPLIYENRTKIASIANHFCNIILSSNLKIVSLWCK